MIELLQTPYANYVVPVILFAAAQFVVFISFLITVYVKMSNKLKELEVRVQMSETRDRDIQTQLSEILDTVHAIELKMEGKQNRH